MFRRSFEVSPLWLNQKLQRRLLYFLARRYHGVVALQEDQELIDGIYKCMY